LSLGLPTVERRKRVLRALSNPLYFGEVYVRPFDPNWTSALPRFAGEMLAFALRERRGVVMLPPEFLKTTLLSQVLPLYLTYEATARQRWLRGMLLSEEEGMAVNNLSVVAWHILNNDYLLADFADEKGQPLVYPDPEEKTWRDDSIIVCRRGTSKDPTWQAKGIDSKGIHGRRLDWLIGDDVVTPANAFSPAKRESALRIWDTQITTRLVRDGKALMAGNFNDPHDLVSTLSAREGYECFKRPAIHVKGEPEIACEPRDPRATPLWPENWDMERLLREQLEKPNRFQRIFLLSATAEKGEKLLVHWMRLVKPEETPLGQSKFYLSVDPAPGGEVEDLDFFNISAGAYHDGQLDLVESYNFRSPIPKQVELIGQFYDRFARIGHGVAAIGVSKLALDHYFRGAVTIKRPDLQDKLIPVSVPGKKEDRLEALGPYAQTGFVRCWTDVWQALTADPLDRFQEMSLYEEWKAFPLGRRDDRLDGLDILCRTVREQEDLTDIEYELIALVG
jgi:hypothetical protein